MLSYAKLNVLEAGGKYTAGEIRQPIQGYAAGCQKPDSPARPAGRWQAVAAKHQTAVAA